MTADESVPIACTLDAVDVPDRITEWKSLLARVESRERIDGGWRLTLAADAPIGDVAALAAAEQACCSFFAFAITIDERGLALEVTGPPDAAELVTSLFGQS